jgi:hypothetical protein
VRAHWGNLATVGDDYLLWFHHVPWDHRLANGRTVWDELVIRYTDGVARVGGMRRAWDALAPAVDAERHAEVAAFLAIQEDEATWWRDASIAYFQSLSHRPLPDGIAAPAHDLDIIRRSGRRTRRGIRSDCRSDPRPDCAQVGMMDGPAPSLPLPKALNRNSSLNGK